MGQIVSSLSQADSKEEIQQVQNKRMAMKTWLDLHFLPTDEYESKTLRQLINVPPHFYEQVKGNHDRYKETYPESKEYEERDGFLSEQDLYDLFSLSMDEMGFAEVSVDDWRDYKYLDKAHLSDEQLNKTLFVDSGELEADKIAYREHQKIKRDKESNSALQRLVDAERGPLELSGVSTAEERSLNIDDAMSLASFDTRSDAGSQKSHSSAQSSLIGINRNENGSYVTLNYKRTQAINLALPQNVISILNCLRSYEDGFPMSSFVRRTAPEPMKEEALTVMKQLIEYYLLEVESGQLPRPPIEFFREEHAALLDQVSQTLTSTPSEEEEEEEEEKEALRPELFNRSEPKTYFKIDKVMALIYASVAVGVNPNYFFNAENDSSRKDPELAEKFQQRKEQEVCNLLSKFLTPARYVLVNSLRQFPCDMEDRLSRSVKALTVQLMWRLIYYAFSESKRDQKTDKVVSDYFRKIKDHSDSSSFVVEVNRIRDQLGLRQENSRLSDDRRSENMTLEDKKEISKMFAYLTRNPEFFVSDIPWNDDIDRARCAEERSPQEVLYRACRKRDYSDYFKEKSDELRQQQSTTPSTPSSSRFRRRLQPLSSSDTTLSSSKNSTFHRHSADNTDALGSDDRSQTPLRRRNRGK